jgi:hypothetical protein
VKRVGIKGAFLDRPGTLLPGIEALSSPARERPLDLLLDKHRQDTESSPDLVWDENRTDGSGEVQSELIAVALLVKAVGELRSSRSSSDRAAYHSGNTWRKPVRFRLARNH